MVAVQVYAARARCILMARRAERALCRLAQLPDARLPPSKALARKTSASEAWVDLSVPQCGYCQTGQIMSAAALLENNPNPTEADVDAAMSGNICRCGCYVRIKEAIMKVGNTSLAYNAADQIEVKA